MSDGLAYVDGNFCPEPEASVPLSDRGFLYGDAAFETLRTYSGVPFLLDRHLVRLYGSCEELGITPRENRGELTAIIGQLVGDLGAGGDVYLRIAVTRGSAYGAWPKNLPRHGRTVAVARPLIPHPPELYTRGLSLATSPLRRAEFSPLAAHKTASYLESILARGAAAEAGADEALILNSAGRVVELACANVFAVACGRLFTPVLEDGALPGVTRAFVLEVAKGLNVPVHCGPLVPEALSDADEAFATNSLIGICPVRQLDGSRVGAEVPGPVTARLQAAYAAEVALQCRPSAR